jgi:hypothetical protein
MRLCPLVFAALGWACAVLATSNNLTDAVTWDKYSLSINGSRVFIKSVQCASTGAKCALTKFAYLAPASSIIRGSQYQNSG